MDIYIFSDFHLGIEKKRDEEIEKIFFGIIESEEVREGSTIVLLGDIFDFWFEYREVILKRNFTFLVKLWELREKYNFVFVCGNHDWWIRDFLPSFKVEVVRKEKIYKIKEKKILLAHGDGYFPRDLLGNLLTKVIRNSFSSSLFYVIHPDLGYLLARGLSRISRHNSSKKEVPEEIPPKVLKHFKQGYDVVILGHFHYPIHIEKDNKLYLNTGDFYKEGTFIHLNSEGIFLRNRKKIIYSFSME